VVQRYGPDVAGGAEQHCRQFATRLAARGHEVEVLTTCARNYVDWGNSYDPGSELVDGVLVHRLPVRRRRDLRTFNSLSDRVLGRRRSAPFYLQREWMRQQGPDVPELVPWLQERASTYDVAVFFTYLYQTTCDGLPVAARLVPTLLHPTVHDEPPLYLDLFDFVFRHPHGFACSTEEEAALVRRRRRSSAASSIIGIGVDLDFVGDAASFRAAHPIGDRPYLLVIGRVDPHKGSQELYDFFRAYKQRNGGELMLVVLGEQVTELEPHPDVVLTGFVDDDARRGALAGAWAVVVPSYFESFSMVLSEAWAARKAALVQGRSDVLTGQAVRSGGGIPYTGFAEFEAAVDMLGEQPALIDALAQRGRRYVEDRYEWDHVLDRYERQLRVVNRWR
jgi:glycosyltransferase involved in cell wall biosynthesis